MRTRTGWLIMLLTAGMAMAPTPVRAQEVPPASPAIPLPLYHDRPETGGFYAAGEFIFWRQTNTLKPQVVAVRGLVDTDGSLQTARNILNFGAVDPVTGLPLPPLPSIPGQFFGSGFPALDSEQLAGPNTYEPGFGLSLGWRFGSGFTLEFSWRHLAETRYSQVASIVPPNYNIGRNGEDQFLFSPVFNFPPEFAGPSIKLAVTNPATSGSSASVVSTPTVIGFIQGVPFVSGFTVTSTATSTGGLAVPQAAYGIWNAATIMTIDFVQRQDQFDLVGRMPLFQNDCSRWYALCGGRHVQMWERFKWRTVSVQTNNPSAGATIALPTNTAATVVSTANGPSVQTPASVTGGTITVGSLTAAAPAISGADDVAIYTNIVSNRMYGPVVGCGTEWYLGKGLSLSLDLRAALFIDVVKERARYEREDKYIAHKRSKSQYVLVPELDALANIWWYPIEGVELRVGYDFMNFFNTVASPRPVDFNYGAVNPVFEKGIYRFVEGFHAGIGFIF